MNDRTDADLVAAVRNGDTDAFGVLVARYRDRYTRFTVRMLGNREDADEVLQDAFLRAYRSIERCDDPARFGGWLYQIVVNECRTKATRRGRRERRFVHDEELIAGTAAPVPEADELLRDEIERALARLEVRHREAFVLKHVEGMSYEEMAEATGDGVSALKMRVKRACERLRELLEGVHHA